MCQKKEKEMKIRRERERMSENKFNPKRFAVCIHKHNVWITDKVELERKFTATQNENIKKGTVGHAAQRHMEKWRLSKLRYKRMEIWTKRFEPYIYLYKGATKLSKTNK